jgi:hypothetical protein
MPYFQVATEALVGAAELVGATENDVSTGRTAVAGSSGACASTPAASACDSLITSIDTVLTSVQGAVTSLEGALGDAARAYVMADSTAANAFVSRGG